MSSPEPATEGKRQGVAVRIILVVMSLAWLFGEGLLEHIRFSIDPWHFNDDVRQQIWPFLRYADAELFRGDYIADYYLANLPQGYRMLYGLTAPLVDPRVLSKVLPYAELLVILYALVAAAWRLAGPAAAWGTGALCLSTTVFLSRIGGGLPRSFGFPLVALTVLALVQGKAWRLCVLTLLGFAFYYPIGLTIGVVTALHLALTPRPWQGDSRDWSPCRRVAALSATAVAAALLTLPALVAVRPFGPPLGLRDLTKYPETGRSGRYDAADLPMPGAFFHSVKEEARATLFSSVPPGNGILKERDRWFALNSLLGLLFGILLVAGFGSLLIAQVSARRLLALMIAPCLLYPIALALWPRLYLPARYITYVVPVFVAVLLPAGAASLLQRLRPMRSSPLASAVVVIGVFALVLPSLGDPGRGQAGISVSIAESERPLYQFLARLPPDAVIAGWPGGPIENVPYLSGRKILHGYEVHQAFHQAYVEEMRRRMEALIDAYFATDLAPLLRLRREFGVTHLLVNRVHYNNPELSYFAPFEERIASVRRAAGVRPETLHQAPNASVFEERWLILLDLDRVAASAERAKDGSGSGT